MTNQELFDTVVRHLVKQGRPAMHTDGSCCYRMADGRRCAIGCLIPDEKYLRGMEGGSCIRPIIYEAAGMTAEQANGIGQSLQSCHDNWTPDQTLLHLGAHMMRNRLCQVATDYGLNASCMPDVDAFIYQEAV